MSVIANPVIVRVNVANVVLLNVWEIDACGILVCYDWTVSKGFSILVYASPVFLFIAVFALTHVLDSG